MNYGYYKLKFIKNNQKMQQCNFISELFKKNILIKHEKTDVKVLFQNKNKQNYSKLSMLKNEQIKNPFASYTFKHVN